MPLNHSLVLLTLALPFACTVGKGDTAGDTGSTTDDGAGSDTSRLTGETGVASTSGETEEGGACPGIDPSAVWNIEFAWNDEGPPGFMPGNEFESELREVPCTVTGVAPGPSFTLDLACTYASEADPRLHEITFTLPPGTVEPQVSVDDTVDLQYRRASGFEEPTREHFELRRDGATILAATDLGEALVGNCYEAELLADFAEFGVAIVHGACEPLTRGRLQFTIDGTAVPLTSSTQGPLAGSYFGVLEEAFHDEAQVSASCTFKVLVLQHGG